MGEMIVAENIGMIYHRMLKRVLALQDISFEVGKGENPLPVRDFFPIYDKVEAMLFTLLAAEE